jgi:hypothetical protein
MTWYRCGKVGRSQCTRQAKATRLRGGSSFSRELDVDALPPAASLRCFDFSRFLSIFLACSASFVRSHTAM